VTLKVIEGTYGLPALGPEHFTPRPPHMMPRPAPFSDATLIVRTTRL
jgi:hypothetical protein